MFWQHCYDTFVSFLLVGFVDSQRSTMLFQPQMGTPVNVFLISQGLRWKRRCPFFSQKSPNATWLSWWSGAVSWTCIYHTAPPSGQCVLRRGPLLSVLVVFSPLCLMCKSRLSTSTGIIPKSSTNHSSFSEITCLLINGVSPNFKMLHRITLYFCEVA